MLKDLKSQNKEDLQKKLVEFISTVEYSELITTTDNLPHIRPMVYVNDGLTIYMASQKSTPKIKQIKSNPNVSVLIIKSLEASAETKEVIIEGQASFVCDAAEREKVFDLFKQKPPTFQDWADKDHDEFEVIKIVPHLVRYFDFSQGESHPKILKVH